MQKPELQFKIQKFEEEQIEQVCDLLSKSFNENEKDALILWNGFIYHYLVCCYFR